MTQAKKAFDRLMNASGSHDQQWKTFEEIDHAVRCLSFSRDDNGTTHRSTWSNPLFPEPILEVSQKHGRIKSGYISRMRNSIIDFLTEVDLRRHPEFKNLSEEYGKKPQ